VSIFTSIFTSIDPSVIGRVLLYCGVTVTIGDVCASLVANSSVGESSAPRRNMRALLALLVALAGVSALFAAQMRAMELSFAVSDVTMLLRDTTWGHGWTMLASAILVSLVTTSANASAWARIVAIGSIAIAMGGLGHAAADDAAPILARVLDAVHVLGIGVWIGTLVCMLRGANRNAWARFSSVATYAAPAVVLSGIAVSYRRIAGGTFATILSNQYAQLLVAKTVLVSVMLILGQMHRRRILKEHAPPITSIRLELLVASVVLMVTAVLTGTAPPGD